MGLSADASLIEIAREEEENKKRKGCGEEGRRHTHYYTSIIQRESSLFDLVRPFSGAFYLNGRNMELRQ